LVVAPPNQPDFIWVQPEDAATPAWPWDAEPATPSATLAASGLLTLKNPEEIEAQEDQDYQDELEWELLHPYTQAKDAHRNDQQEAEIATLPAGESPSMESVSDVPGASMQPQISPTHWSASEPHVPSPKGVADYYEMVNEFDPYADDEDTPIAEIIAIRQLHLNAEREDPPSEIEATQASLR
jgi:hypothetical protein